MTYNQPAPAQPLSDSDARLWATLTHVSALVGIVAGAGFVGWLGPLIIYVVFKDRSAFVVEHAKTTLNFQITMFIAVAASWLLAAVTLFLLFFVPILVSIAVGIVVIVFSIIAAIAANRGQSYRYPLTIPFIK